MAMAELRVSETLELVNIGMAQAHAWLSERSRTIHLDAGVSAREAISHRILSESGGGQARAQLPGGAGGVPTVVSGPTP